MSTIAARLAIATERASVPLAAAHGIARASATTLHVPAAAPVILIVLAIALVTFVSRVNSELVSLVSHLIQTAASVARALFLIVVVTVVATIVMLHL